MAIIYLTRGHLQPAESSAARAVRCAPKEATYLATLAWVLIELGRGDGARMIEEVSATAPDEAHVDFVMGLSHERKKQFEKAALHFGEASARESKRDDYRRAHARALHLAGKADAALDAYLGLKRVWPEDVNALLFLARVLADEGKAQPACRAYAFLRVNVPSEKIRIDELAEKLTCATISSYPGASPETLTPKL
jgi:tetratricopeptide (TPR) repeat protein